MVYNLQNTMHNTFDKKQTTGISLPGNVNREIRCRFSGSRSHSPVFNRESTAKC